MESSPRELDEETLDASIAEILNQEAPASKPVADSAPARSEFPSLKSQEGLAAKADTGRRSILRQTWAQLSGAA
ncbi:hypothetical protein [uncultured Ruegeria sp.]|uniref:hypothetical protein n=1 Tax=uncultured Ruegeria sp. TaxID=259304 RepID=UPI00261C685F|nr:hypothetical protein [uncultured Ruegeria sp.]